MEKMNVLFMHSGQNYRHPQGVCRVGRGTCQQNGRYSAIVARPIPLFRRVLSHPFQRSSAVYRALFPLLLIFLALPGVVRGQSAATITAHLRAVAEAGTDALRDSASDRLKADLRAVLSSDSAFTADFPKVPISRVDAPDGKLRLFTWNVPRTNGTHRYEGLLLVNKGRKQVLYELRDMTEQITDPAFAPLSPENWYGALYYALVPVKRGAKTYYTLLGWKGQSAVETQKVVEVLSISGSMPRFGAPLFPGERKRPLRQVYAYSAQATMQLRWDPVRKAIILDHLSPTKPEFAGQAAFMAPDLTFDSWTWDKDHWRLDRDIDFRGGGKGKPYNAPPKETR